MQELSKAGLTPAQQLDEARTSFDAARARLDALARQTEGQRAALQVTRANAEQVSVRRSAVATAQHQLEAVGAQRTKADVRLSYTNISAPLDGIVDVRAARQGEVVNPGQPISP